ncbi:MAG: hypothetical protein K9G76_01795 [Bacteroidales bacterium]|nr:hypothetical protein [Bacteroidales bacterium]MCF8403287.1 hypothetical protein [Bacteroidales bacterium]
MKKGIIYFGIKKAQEQMEDIGLKLFSSAKISVLINSHRGEYSLVCIYSKNADTKNEKFPDNTCLIN